MEKKFFHYFNYDGMPLINEVTYPHCPFMEEHYISFLVYAKDKNYAFKLAMSHIYEDYCVQQIIH